MGMLDRFQQGSSEPEQPWTPPAFGTCLCEGHIEDVLELRLPLADGTDDMAVWALLTCGALGTVPMSEEQRHLSNGLTLELQGPFHYLITPGGKFAAFLSEDAPVSLEDSMSVQPGVERAMWLTRHGELAVGAPTLCINGVQWAVVVALMNPRVRAAPAPDILAW